MSAPEVALTTDVDGPSYDESVVLLASGFAIDVVIKTMSENAVKTPSEPKPPKASRPAKVRTGNATRALSIAGAIGLVFSVILATGALLIALDVNQGSAFFAHLSDVCDALVGPLKDVFSFSGVNAGKKEALVGWGIGSMGYLLVGRFVQSILMSRVKD